MYGTAAACLSGVFLQTSRLGRGYETVQIARNLYQTGEFANPYATMSTGLTAHAAPLFPAFLSTLLLAVHGNSLLFARLATACAAMAFGVLLALIPEIAQIFIGNRKAGTIVSAALIVIPVFPTIGQSEAIYVALGLSGFALLVERNTGSPLRLGILCGMLLLLSPSVVPFIAVYLFGAFMRRVLTARLIAVIALVSFALCLPWMLRNQFRLGTFSIRDNFGLELQANNNSFSSPDSSGIFASNSRYHPNMNIHQAELVRDIGEVRFNDRKCIEAVKWIRSNPRAFAALSLKRFLRFWLPGWYQMPFAIGVWVVTLASIPQIIRVFCKERGTAVWYLILSMMAFSFPYYFFLGELRYRIPVLWVTTLLSCPVLAQLCQQFRRLSAR